jgi:hypothetical protein
MIIKCPGCLAEFQKTTDEPISHPYIGALPECWSIFNEILAKEFSDPEYFKVHRITVDAYCASHIGDQNDRRARQSANLHLMALYLMFEEKKEGKDILSFLKKMTETKRDWPPLLQRDHSQWLTVKDVIQARDAFSHSIRITEWGNSVWESYMDCHSQIRVTYKQSITS